jgi:hypothetical protein
VLVYTELRDVINRGADMFNPPKSDHAGCANLYREALSDLLPYLKDYPDLSGAVEKVLKEAPEEKSVPTRAFMYRKVIDGIRGRFRAARLPLA